jgi:hypothetical protein
VVARPGGTHATLWCASLLAPSGSSLDFVSCQKK